MLLKISTSITTTTINKKTQDLMKNGFHGTLLKVSHPKVHKEWTSAQIKMLIFVVCPLTLLGWVSFLAIIFKKFIRELHKASQPYKYQIEWIGIIVLLFTMLWRTTTAPKTQATKIPVAKCGTNYLWKSNRRRQKERNG